MGHVSSDKSTFGVSHAAIYCGTVALVFSQIVVYVKDLAADGCAAVAAARYCRLAAALWSPVVQQQALYQHRQCDLSLGKLHARN